MSLPDPDDGAEITHPLSDVETLTIHVTDLINAINFNERSANRENAVLRVTTDGFSTEFPANATAELFHKGNTRYPDVPQEPYHIDPETILGGTDQRKHREIPAEVQYWVENPGEEGPLWEEFVTNHVQNRVEEITFKTHIISTDADHIGTTVTLNVIDDRDDE